MSAIAGAQTQNTFANKNKRFKQQNINFIL